MSDEENDLERKEFSKLISAQSKKKKKSGGFQSMGLHQEIFKGVLKKGYRIPTPIQRKAIPIILEGHDVVAMARTGSGKTAAFLIPLFQKLKARIAKAGARALVLSPTRELALQTLKFTRDLGRFTGLKSVCILGGESMEKQFSQIHENPDILIATPGRFVHLCVEMNLKLDSIEYVCFDEADRLFEMGFGEQLREILGRLPQGRQTVLFSATLPKILVDFAKAGLSEPTLIRLDVDNKIPETLKMGFLHCREEGKTAVLLHLFRHVINQDQNKPEQTVVFCATRHHVEYLHLLLDSAGISNSYIYSQLDATARKINAAKFQTKKVNVLLVTDLAARGIDIPMLDNVINFNFPSKSKLFVHRVGRVARAGRAGTAYSLVAGDEMAYFIDLQLFLGSSVEFIPVEDKNSQEDWDKLLGRCPQDIYDDYADELSAWHESSLELESAKKTAENGMKQYLKSRSAASDESLKRSKKTKLESIGIHPLMTSVEAEGEATKKDQEASKMRSDFLRDMRKFRPQSTIFEIGNTQKSSQVAGVMSRKRKIHESAIERFQLKTETELKESIEKNSKKSKVEEQSSETAGDSATQEDISSTFGAKVLTQKPLKDAKVFNKKKFDKNKNVKQKKFSKKINEKDEENFIGYQSKDYHTEAGYSVTSNNNFEAQAAGATLDLTGDDGDTIRMKRNAMRWDAKTKKYVRADQNEGKNKKIKTESGVWIPASYKSNRYAKWKERSKQTHREDAEADNEDGDGEQGGFKGHKRFGRGGNQNRNDKSFQNHPALKKAAAAMPKHKKGPKSEIKRPEQILKERKLKAKQAAKQARGGKKKNKKR